MKKINSSRRDFIKFSSLLLPTASFLEKASAHNGQHRDEPQGLFIHQASASSESTTIVLTLLPQFIAAIGSFQFEIFDSTGNLHTNWSLEEKSPYPEQARVYHLRVSRLDPRKLYELVFFHNGAALSRRTFQSLSERTGSLVAGSCSNVSVTQGQNEIWKMMASQKFDALFYYGDCVYSDSTLDSVFGQPTRPEKAYSKFIKTISTLGLYKRQHLVPLFNVWDDHDYGWNNGDMNHPYLDQMKYIFRSFFPLNEGPRLVIGPHLCFSILLHGIRYIFLDGRSSRNYSQKQNQFISNEIKSWIISQVQASKNPVAIVSGSQLCGFGLNNDSIEQAHPRDFTWFKELVSQSQIPIFFLSGDTHYSHIQLLNWGMNQTAEITSSGLHSYSFTGNGKRSPDQGQIAYFKGANFSLLNLIGRQSQVYGNVTCLGTKGPEYVRTLNLGI